METLIDDKFNKIILDSESGIHYQIVKAETALIRESELQDMLLTWKKTVFETQAALLLVDNRKFQSAVSPEMQIWAAENISAPVLALDSVTKFCFVMPEEFVANLSVSQLTTESSKVAGNTLMKYFANKEEAEQWLMSAV